MSFIGDKWFLIFQCATYICSFVFWLIYVIASEGWMWYHLFILILAILSAVSCILLVIPCQRNQFKLIYLVVTSVHYLSVWIWFLDRCGGGAGRKHRSWVSFTLSQFLMITCLFICEFLVIFSFSAKLTPE